MKLRYISIALGLTSVIVAANCAIAGQGGNLNGIKPAIFPVSPITPPPGVPTQFDVIGHIQSAAVDHRVCPGSANLDPRLYGGWVTVNGVEITIPCNTILQMPATSLTWAELFDPALVPAGTPPGTSGLALEDRDTTPGALPLPSYEIHIQGNIVKDAATGVSKYIAGLVFISQQSLNLGQGYIKSIDYVTGELCVSSSLPANGLTGQSMVTPDCLSPDARVRINDPVGRFGLKHGGPGCIAQGTCDVEENLYDQRFTADTDNPTIHAATGFPMCIPRAYPFSTSGDTDALCPQQNRPKQGVNSSKCRNLPVASGVNFPAFPAQNDGYCHSFVMDALPVNPAPAPGPCGTITATNGATTNIPCTTRADRQAPFEVGDYIDYSGTLTADVNTANSMFVSPYFISAHTINAHIGIYTYPGSKPVYVMIEGLLAGTNALPIQNIPQVVTGRVNVEGFTTDPSSLVDIFAMDVDKVTGVVTERLLSSVNPSGPPVIGRASFVPATGAYGPPTRNVRIVSRSMCNSRTMPCYIPQAYLDPKNPAGKYANGLVAGQYNAPNFEYIFTKNLFLGDPVLPNNFQDLAFLACGSGPLTTASAGTNPPIVGTLDPAPWAQPMPAPSQCAGKMAMQLTIPATQTPDAVRVIKATWDNEQNKGILKVTATSSLRNTTPNLQLYVQAVSASGLQMASDPQPMQLVTNPAVAPAGGLPCPVGNNPCWQYTASGTILDALHPKGNPSLPNNIYTLPVTVNVYSSRGGVGSIVPTLLCGVITSPATGLVNTCQF